MLKLKKPENQPEIRSNPDCREGRRHNLPAKNKSKSSQNKQISIQSLKFSYNFHNQYSVNNYQASQVSKNKRNEMKINCENTKILKNLSRDLKSIKIEANGNSISKKYYH